MTRQRIPIARVAGLPADTCGIPVSTGVIVAVVKEGADRLQEFLSQVRGLWCSSLVVHADEAGLRVEALLAWVHAASTTGLTLCHLDRRRGTVAMDVMGVLRRLSGVLVRDGWTPIATAATSPAPCATLTPWGAGSGGRERRAAVGDRHGGPARRHLAPCARGEG